MAKPVGMAKPGHSPPSYSQQKVIEAASPQYVCTGYPIRECEPTHFPEDASVATLQQALFSLRAQSYRVRFGATCSGRARLTNETGPKFLVDQSATGPTRGYCMPGQTGPYMTAPLGDELAA